MMVADEVCCACEERPATTSLNAHPLCGRCSGDAEFAAHEYAIEVEAARARRAERQEHDHPRIVAALSRLSGHTRSQSTQTGHRYGEKQRRALAQANKEKAERSRAIRHAAVLGVLEREGPQSASSLALITALSLATVKRTLAELCLEKTIESKRALKSCTFLYRIRSGSRWPRSLQPVTVSPR